MRLLGFPRLSPVILVYNTPEGEGRGERGEGRGERGEGRGERGESEDLRDHVVFRGNGVGIGLILLFWFTALFTIKNQLFIIAWGEGRVRGF